MNGLWRCKICGAIFNTFEEAEFHLEHTDSIHARWVYEKGTWECLEEIKPENLANYKYKYPYYPYYKAPKDFPVKVTENIYSNKEGSRFFDVISKKEYSGDKLIDFLKKEGRDKELKEFLKWKVKLHFKRIASMTGITITDEQLEKMTETEILAQMYREYFTHEDKRERLGLYALKGIEETYQFLNGERDICKYCHMNEDSWLLSSEYERNRILEQTKIKAKDNKELRELLSKRGFHFIYNDKKGFMPMKVFLHLCTDHYERLKKMIQSKRLTFTKEGVNEYVLSKKWAQKGKRSKQTLSDTFRVPRVEEKLCPKEKLIHQWLKGEA